MKLTKNVVTSLIIVGIVNLALYFLGVWIAEPLNSPNNIHFTQNYLVLDVIFIMTLGNILIMFYLMLRYVNNEKSRMTLMNLFTLQNPATFYIADATNQQEQSGIGKLKQVLSFPRVFRIYCFMILSLVGIINIIVLYVQ